MPFNESFAHATEARKSKIKIKKKNRGKFTATKRRTGKTTAQLRKSKNPLTRKRAVFAANAKAWAKKRKRSRRK